MNWIPLINEDQLLEIKQASQEQPVMIFKHSTSCSTSAMAHVKINGNLIRNTAVPEQI